MWAPEKKIGRDKALILLPLGDICQSVRKVTRGERIMKRKLNSKITKVFHGVGLTLLLILTFVGHAKAVTLNRGDILVAAVGAIIRVDPTTGVQTVISSGVNLVGPTGLAMDRAGDILVADIGAGAVIRVNPTTGGQTVISSGGFFSFPFDLAIDGAGKILVVDSVAFGGPGGIIRVDPTTGAQTVISSGGNFVDPSGITLDAAGQILVADVDFGGSPGVSGPGAVILVDPVTGAQTVVSTGGNFIGPVRVVVDAAGQIIVSDHASFKIIRVDPGTGVQTVISSGGSLKGPEGLTLDATGQVLVVFDDPNAVSTGVIRVDPVTGVQMVISSGGSLVNPRGIAVVAGSPAAPNAPPEVGALSSVPAAVGDSVLVAAGSSVAFSAPWTDSNVSDTHTAVCNIVDVFGTIPTAAVSGTAPGSGSGTAACDFTFANTGIFSVTMTVTDQDGASGTSTAIQVVVYDPSAGFVTGGGWFTPDPQTCVCTPGGKATFGLVTKYQRGSSVPSGNQEFQYQVENINLHSNSFDWLVVSGPQAQFQGTGTINGEGAYKFRVTVRDGDLIGQPDRFEIRILPAGSADFGGVHLWKGGNDLIDPTGAGSVVIH